MNFALSKSQVVTSQEIIAIGMAIEQTNVEITTLKNSLPLENAAYVVVVALETIALENSHGTCI